VKIASEWIFLGSTQIRRLRLPRVGDGNGSVSYHELVGLVVTFTFPEGSPENFHVSLNYLDVDQDTITISSSEELVDAIEQFSGKKVLRIDTEVKPKTTSGGTPKTSPRETSTASTSTPAVQHTTTPRASQTDGGTSPPSQDLPIATILNSFVGVLATAVVALQEGLSAPAGASAKKASKAAHAAVDKASIAVGKASDAVSAAASKASTTASKASAAAASAAASATEDASKATDNSASMPDLKPASKDQAAGSQESTETEEEEEEPRPFIHGRHTCDSCLTTPIVGKRCHAKNLPDYDLCQNCFENYNGTEIAFEFVELGKRKYALGDSKIYITTRSSLEYFRFPFRPRSRFPGSLAAPPQCDFEEEWRGKWRMPSRTQVWYGWPRPSLWTSWASFRTRWTSWASRTALSASWA
jgi:hypothetical protein